MSEPLLAPFEEVAQRTADAYGLAGLVMWAVDATGAIHASVNEPTSPRHRVDLAAELRTAARRLEGQPAREPVLTLVVPAR